ncbi:unnamed protein product [Protopolystoma xenopodis]|uniref:Uncharacterized protein n=1 Tax=Protopolystoma xenopodis TaxID=117903 RepID=A0A448XIZ8_9PLAT|nr:unnamed protein product [Protopolystoma xenopodis]
MSSARVVNSNKHLERGGPKFHVTGERDWVSNWFHNYRMRNRNHSTMNHYHHMRQNSSSITTECDMHTIAKSNESSTKGSSSFPSDPEAPKNTTFSIPSGLLSNGSSYFQDTHHKSHSYHFKKQRRSASSTSHPSPLHLQNIVAVDISKTNIQLQPSPNEPLDSSLPDDTKTLIPMSSGSRHEPPSNSYTIGPRRRKGINPPRRLIFPS